MQAQNSGLLFHDQDLNFDIVLQNLLSEII